VSPTAAGYLTPWVGAATGLAAADFSAGLTYAWKKEKVAGVAKVAAGAALAPQVETFKGSAAATELALRKGNDEKNLDTLGGVVGRTTVGMLGTLSGGFMATRAKPTPAEVPMPTGAQLEAIGESAVAAINEARGGLLGTLAGRARQQAGFSESGTPIILDECLAGTNVAEQLRERGFNVRDVGEIFGSWGMPDSEILEAAKTMGARVLTADRGQNRGGGFGTDAIQVDGRVGHHVDTIARILSNSEGVAPAQPKGQGSGSQ
jgi:hypothetical protein